MKKVFFCIMVMLLTVSVAQGQTTTHDSPDFFVQTGVRLIDTIYDTCNSSSQTQCLIAMAEYAQKHEYPDETTAQQSKHFTVYFVKLSYACKHENVSKEQCIGTFVESIPKS